MMEQRNECIAALRDTTTDIREIRHRIESNVVWFEDSIMNEWRFKEAIKALERAESMIGHLE